LASLHVQFSGGGIRDLMESRMGCGGGEGEGGGWMGLPHCG
jgi:hypothetical protein